MDTIVHGRREGSHLKINGRTTQTRIPSRQRVWAMDEKNERRMKEGTLVWIVASVEDDALQVNCDKDEIVVEPHGFRAMPLYADKQWVKPLTQEEIEEYNKEL